MTNKLRLLFFAAMLAMAAVVVFADDPTPADPFCPEGVPPPCAAAR